MQMPKYVTRLDQVPQLSPEEREALRKVESVYAFRSNEYYLSLIDWNDPNDPIRRLIIPSLDELEDWGELDPSGEKHYIVAPGVEHKYERTAVFLASRVCGGICRVCFRKRLFKRRRTIGLEVLSTAPQFGRVCLEGSLGDYLDPERLYVETKAQKSEQFYVQSPTHYNAIKEGGRRCPWRASRAAAPAASLSASSPTATWWPPQVTSTRSALTKP